MPLVIADTSLLVAFSGIDRLDVLQGVFPEVAIPPAVLVELEVGDWKEATAALRAIRAGDWIRMQHAASISLPVAAPASLGAGELQVLSLAFQLGKSALIDDGQACWFAARIAVPVIRSLAILARAKEIELIEAARPLVIGMLQNGIRFSPELISRFLATMGES
jgi:predicted nucleic acid-binding protein